MTPRPSALAVAVAFVANGFGGPSFLARLPERQADLNLSDAGLGLVLTGMAVGALVASPPAGRLVEALGSRAVVLGATTILGASLWTIGAAHNAVTMFVALALVGAADAAMDTAMNANGAAFEHVSGRSVMHRLHASWSFGALAAATLAGALAALGIPLTFHLALVGAAIAGSVLACRGGLVTGRVATLPLLLSSSPAGAPTPAPSPDGEVTPADALSPDGARSADALSVPPDVAPSTDGAPSPGARSSRRGVDTTARRPARRVPGGPLLLLAAITAAATLLEGIPYDWATLRLEDLGVGTGASAAGFAAFMAGMLGGRLVGDTLTERIGRASVLRLGLALAAVGFTGATASNVPAGFVAGLTVAGFGASWFVPLAFSAASRTPGVPPGAGAATVSLSLRLGFLAEPLLVGAISELVGLRWAFGLVAVVAVVLMVASPRIMPSVQSPEPDPALTTKGTP